MKRGTFPGAKEITMTKKGILFITAITVMALAVFAGASDVPWTPITGNEHNMIAHGTLNAAIGDFSSGSWVIASFGDTGDKDCRSASAINADGSFYTTIRGNQAGEMISLKLFDKESGAIVVLSQIIEFKPDMVVVADRWE